MNDFFNGICRKINIEDEYDINSDEHNLILFAQVYDEAMDLWSSQTMCTTDCPCSTDMNLDIYPEVILNMY